MASPGAPTGGPPLLFAPQGIVRHIRPSRHISRVLVQRGAHPRDHAGDLPLPPAERNRRPALPRHRHPRPLRSRRSPAALEVLAANGVEVMIDDRDGYTPTPVVSHAILTYNRGKKDRTRRRHRRHAVAQSARGRRDSSTTRHGGPADTDVTRGSRTGRTSSWPTACRRCEAHSLRARLQRARPRTVTTTWAPTSATSRRSSTSTPFAAPTSRSASTRSAARASPTGEPIAERYRPALTVVSDAVDATFRFMTVDWDGKIRMDCSSPYAMARLIGLKDRFDVGVGVRHRSRPARHRDPERRDF